MKKSLYAPEEPHDTSNDEAIREYGRQRALDALTRCALTSKNKKNITLINKNKKISSAIIWPLIATAACISGFIMLSQDNHQKPTKTSPISLNSNWKITPTANTDYTIISPNHIKLNQGELRLTSSKTTKIKIETPQAIATAQNTDFIIGHHKENNEPSNNMKLNNLTRMLVLTGIATMTTQQGSLQASENESIIAKDNGELEKIVVTANSKFAFDLYSQLAKEKPGQNIFFSPYSTSSALLLAAEAANGITKQEIINTLRYNHPLNHLNNSSQNIPTETNKILSGFNSVNKLLQENSTAQEQLVIENKLNAVSKQLDKFLRLKNTNSYTQDETQNNKPSGPDKKLYTLKQLDKKLAELRKEYKKLYEKLNHNELYIANSIWIDKSLNVKNTYIDKLKNTLGNDTIQFADFKNTPEIARKHMNQWVEEKTKNNIKNVYRAGSITPEIILTIGNAIFFKSRWNSEFKPEDTKINNFHLHSGDIIKTPFMYANHMKNTSYAKFDDKGEALYTHQKNGFSMIELPYHKRKLSMVIIAPHKETRITSLESIMNEKNITKWMKQMKPSDVYVSIPKFKTKTDYNLTTTLNKMGIKSAFNNTANLTNISNVKPLYLSRINHKAQIEVDESGSTAFAHTEIEISLGVPTIQKFIANKPFIYLIKDNKSGTILFLGRMMNPKE